MENIESRIVTFSALHDEIFNNLHNFCKDFEICFEEQSLKTKHNILLFFSIKKLLEFFNSKNIKNPIILYDRVSKNVLIDKVLKKVSKILTIPIFYYESISFSKGFYKELCVKSDNYEEKNLFTIKKLEKLLGKNNQFLSLKEDILKFKIPFRF